MTTTDLNRLDDDFDNRSSYSNWLTHHEAEGWPSFLSKAEINESESIFYLEPSTSAWYGEFHRSPFYFKLVTGNFTMVTKLKVTGLHTSSPNKGFSLAGLMLRSPRAINVEKDKLGHENWMFLSTGSATKNGKPQFESKNTVKGKSKLKVFSSKQGWIYLSISRVENRFYQCYRYEGEQQWMLLRVVERGDMTNEVQAGMVAYSGFWNLMKWYFNPKKFNTKETKNSADLVARFDFVKFRRVDRFLLSNKLVDGFYNQPMPLDLIENLKLEGI